MAGTWLRIRVDLLEGLGLQLDPPPGRVLIVGPWVKSSPSETVSTTMNAA